MIGIDSIKGLKHRDLQACIFCGHGMMHGGNVSFYRVTVERCVVNIPAIQRAAGLEQMMGGHALLANILGPDEDLVKILPGPGDCFVCENCGIWKKTFIAELGECIADRKKDAPAPVPEPPPPDVDHTRGGF